jgi:hypothetical protein
LSAFGGGSLQGSDQEDADVNKIQEAIDRIARFIRFIKRTIRNKLCCCLIRKKKIKKINECKPINGVNLLENKNEGISISLEGEFKQFLP